VQENCGKSRKKTIVRKSKKSRVKRTPYTLFASEQNRLREVAGQELKAGLDF
jgi:hypothetical protein